MRMHTPLLVFMSAAVAISAGTFPAQATAGDEQWDARFSPLGVLGGAHALAASGSDVYVGGVFVAAGGIFATNIAKWDGRSWSSMGTGMNSNVVAMAASGSNVYVGGNFTKAGGVNANRIARWNG